jgi:hypothetical protein
MQYNGIESAAPEKGRFAIFLFGNNTSDLWETGNKCHAVLQKFQDFHTIFLKENLNPKIKYI